MREAIQKIVGSIVDDPEAVEITEQSDNAKNVRLSVRVAPGDYGRIIGREGRTIRAIRSVLHFAGVKNGKRYHLDLIED